MQPAKPAKPDASMIAGGKFPSWNPGEPKTCLPSAMGVKRTIR